ncbi:hypothetical protein ACFWWC_13910 [Streptomyces sp. NPDC058642]|uniref:hypothetical protein n=1 Tax=Streptomyces sp. NPDC058642 TaxID=3346572 RepID=UPI00364F0C0B
MAAQGQPESLDADAAVGQHFERKIRTTDKGTPAVDQRKSRNKNNSKKSAWTAAFGLALAIFAVTTPAISGSAPVTDVRAAEPSAVLLDTSWPTPTP